MSRKGLAELLSMTLCVAAVFSFSTRVFAQEVIANEALDEWFYSRLLWAAVIGVVAGIVIGLVVLCRIKFEIKGALHINNYARRKLFLWTVIIFALGAILLLLDAWLLFPFGTLSLTFSDALTQVWSNYRMLLILGETIIVFILVAAITTRFKSGCRCRYAFIPGPKGK